MAGWRSAWREPRPADPPPTGRWDWIIASGFAGATLVEGVTRRGLPWQPFVIALALGVAPAFLWRRRHPLVACLIGFGAAGLLSILQLVTHRTDVGPTSMTAVVILLYSLVRWGSGREVVLGVAAVAAVAALGMVVTHATLAEMIGGTLFLMLAIALGAIVRNRAELWTRQQRDARNEERLALARELHDTVAHHVSAIAVQAQAGGVVAAEQPARAAAILAAIETEASRTLAEMRAMVRVLREDEMEAHPSPRGVADLAALVRTDQHPRVVVSVDDSAMGRPRSVDAAVYRLAQESVTNALRHARAATQVAIEVDRVGDVVRLRVTDDGRTPPGQVVKPGFGLTGMAERAQLLGGSLTAGPGPQGGWAVDAVLPAGGSL
ncbi:sensor histidine kinase [Janibacter sp. G56]|uniref:sensor histidine kinase n=1 Tax=Janibacter sp. G56 TaxID=3418717 RepID=UPI003D0224AA